MSIKIIQPGVEILTPLYHAREGLRICEIAARNCYKSERRLGADPGFLMRLIRQHGHVSVIEHATVSVRFVVSRSTSHQIVRHRIAAYSQESQRYVDYVRRGGVLKVIEPRTIRDGLPTTRDTWITAMDFAWTRYRQLREAGVPPEDARSVLPNAAATQVVATYNLRTWRDIIKARALNAHAQDEIRNVFLLALMALDEGLPEIFGDLGLDDASPYGVSIYRSEYEGGHRLMETDKFWPKEAA